MLRIRVSRDNLPLTADALGWAVALLAFAGIAVNLDQHRVVDSLAESLVNSRQIGAESITGQLDAIGEASSEIVHEVASSNRVALPDHPGANELAIGVHCDPRPHVASDASFKHLRSDVLLFRIDERPNLIDLNPLTGKVAKCLVHVG